MDQETKDDLRRSEIYDETLPFVKWRLANPTLTMIEALSLYRENLLLKLKE